MTYSEPALAILGLDSVEVAEPVAVPSPEGGGVVNADSVDAVECQRRLSAWEFPENLPLNLKAGPLERAGVVPKRSGGISATEDVFVQVDAPEEVLVLPGLAETGELDVHGAVILKHVVTLAEESGKLLDTDVLAHLELRDLVELLLRNVAVVHAENVALLLGNTGGAESVSSVGGALFSDGNTGDLGAVVQRCEFGKSTPAAADVEHLLAFLQLELLADDGHLVVLQFLKSLLTGRV